MTKKQLFKKSYAKELLRIAESDLESSELLFSTGKARPETVIFHVQQALEKAIKAVICHYGIEVLMLLDIGALIGSLPEDKQPPHGFDLTRFNDFAGILRYEEGRAILLDEDQTVAIDVGKEVIAWANSHILEV